jgi:hypothetical protein
MNNFKDDFAKKINDKSNDIRAGFTVAAVLAATYLLGKSRGKIVVISTTSDLETVHSVHKR